MFDGASFVLNGDGTVVVQLPAWEEALGLTEWRREGGRVALPAPARSPRSSRDEAANYLACVTGLARLRQQERLSGRGARALGRHRLGAVRGAWRSMRSAPTRVHGVMLPYTYTSNESLSDAAATAEALHIRYDIMPIHAAVEGLTKGLAKAFAGTTPDATEENLQSRARGTLLMAHFQQVRADGADHRQQIRGLGRLCHALWRHEWRLQSDQGPLQGPGLCARALPQSRAAQGVPRAGRPSSFRRTCSTKAPTAELKPDQRDQDTLPPYDVLDDILNCLVELRDAVAGDRGARARARDR